MATWDELYQANEEVSSEPATQPSTQPKVSWDDLYANDTTQAAEAPVEQQPVTNTVGYPTKQDTYGIDPVVLQQSKPITSVITEKLYDVLVPDSVKKVNEDAGVGIEKGITDTVKGVADLVDDMFNTGLHTLGSDYNFDLSGRVPVSDTLDERYNQAKERSPIATTVGELAPLALVPAGGSVTSAAAIGGLLGAAKETDSDSIFQDRALSAATGALLGGGLQKGGEVLGKALGKRAEVIDGQEAFNRLTGQEVSRGVGQASESGLSNNLRKAERLATEGSLGLGDTLPKQTRQLEEGIETLYNKATQTVDPTTALRDITDASNQGINIGLREAIPAANFTNSKLSTATKIINDPTVNDVLAKVTNGQATGTDITLAILKLGSFKKSKTLGGAANIIESELVTASKNNPVAHKAITDIMNQANLLDGLGVYTVDAKDLFTQLATTKGRKVAIDMVNNARQGGIETKALADKLNSSYLDNVIKFTDDKIDVKKTAIAMKDNKHFLELLKAAGSEGQQIAKDMDSVSKFLAAMKVEGKSQVPNAIQNFINEKLGSKVGSFLAPVVGNVGGRITSGTLGALSGGKTIAAAMIARTVGKTAVAMMDRITKLTGFQRIKAIRELENHLGRGNSTVGKVKDSFTYAPEVVATRTIARDEVDEL